MKSTTYLSKNLGMGTAEFMGQWKTLTDDEKEWYRQAARDEAAALGVELEDA